MNSEMSMKREKGLVKWFSNKKGYGFILRASGGEIFVHYSGILMDGYKKLFSGDVVEYDVQQADGGKFIAKNVKLLSKSKVKNRPKRKDNETKTNKKEV